MINELLGISASESTKKMDIVLSLDEIISL